MIKIWFLVAAGICLATATSDSISSTDYCEIASCGIRPHTMCLYNTPLVEAFNCKNSIFIPFFHRGETMEIVYLHNEIRAKVARGEETRGLSNQPQPAGIIGPLYWDEELAMIAQRWANQCKSYNDQCRDTEKESVGQNMINLRLKVSKILTMDLLVLPWYNQVDNFDPKYIKNFNMDQETIDHAGKYTQMVWANTTKIGCGMMKSFNATEQMVYATLVCNYGPSGNVFGHRIY